LLEKQSRGKSRCQNDGLGVREVDVGQVFQDVSAKTRNLALLVGLSLFCAAVASQRRVQAFSARISIMWLSPTALKAMASGQRSISPRGSRIE
jgi:hypothetical protein